MCVPIIEFFFFFLGEDEINQGSHKVISAKAEGWQSSTLYKDWRKVSQNHNSNDKKKHHKMQIQKASGLKLVTSKQYHHKQM